MSYKKYDSVKCHFFVCWFMGWKAPDHAWLVVGAEEITFIGWKLKQSKYLAEVIRYLVISSGWSILMG